MNRGYATAHTSNSRPFCIMFVFPRQQLDRQMGVCQEWFAIHSMWHVDFFGSHVKFYIDYLSMMEKMTKNNQIIKQRNALLLRLSVPELLPVKTEDVHVKEQNHSTHSKVTSSGEFGVWLPRGLCCCSLRKLIAVWFQ